MGDLALFYCACFCEREKHPSKGGHGWIGRVEKVLTLVEEENNAVS